MKFLTILLSLGSFLGFVSRVKDFVDERSDDISDISDRIPDTPRADDSPSGDDVPNRVPELPDVTAQDLSGDYIAGTGADERLVGGSGSDLIVGGGGQDKIITGSGDDYAWALNASGLTGIYTQGGNDTIAASVPGSGQIHIGAGDGDDRIILDMTNETGFQAHHVYTGTGQDRIEFENIDAVDAPILGRIDDFDPSRDVLLLEGQVLDLQNLPDGVDVVAYNGQQWLRIEDRALYALEGARDGGTERHFTELPDDLTSLQVVSYVDPQNFAPAEDVETAGLNRIDADSRHVMGTGEDDWITDTQVHGQSSSSSGGHDHGTGSGDVIESASVHFMAGDGNDVVDAGKGDDTVYGGDGDDALAGGIDNDVLYGESGADRLYGGSEQDTLDGGAGDDQLFGGTGDDLLTGGAGADHMTGGEGQDRFHFGAGDLQVWDSLEGTDDEKYAQLDVIEDFRIGEDVISFEGDPGITLDDIDAWTVEVQGSALTAVHIQSTGERFLVNVDSEEDGGQEDWSALMDDGNFSF